MWPNVAGRIVEEHQAGRTGKHEAAGRWSEYDEGGPTLIGPSNTRTSVGGARMKRSRLGFVRVVSWAVTMTVLILYTTRPPMPETVNHRTISYETEHGKKLALPSARLALEKKPVFPPIHRLSNLTMSPNTIVSAYFRVSSKHSAAQYDIWMENFLSLQDHMVIFTSEDMLGKIELSRAHALDRTVVIIMELEDVPLASLYGASFWEDQLDRDVEKESHKSYKLFWICKCP